MEPEEDELVIQARMSKEICISIVTYINHSTLLDLYMYHDMASSFRHIVQRHPKQILQVMMRRNHFVAMNGKNYGTSTIRMVVSSTCTLRGCLVAHYFRTRVVHELYMYDAAL